MLPDLPTAMPKLTEKAVDILAPDPDHDQFIWDSDLAGFGVRVYPTGRRVYIAQYRTAAGQTRRQSLGQHGTITTEQARRKAQEVLSQARLGHDPNGERYAARTATTMTQLCGIGADGEQASKVMETNCTDVSR
jgi:Arm DNA-binding domain